MSIRNRIARPEWDTLYYSDEDFGLGVLRFHEEIRSELEAQAIVDEEARCR
jgi:hypothetical protein